MRLYNFISREHGLSNLKHRRLKIATLNDINDPFELLATRSTNKKDREIFYRFREKWAAQFGMLCFSRGWNNPVLWSHYGEKHKGMCLGFEVPEGYYSEVIYSEERLEFNWDAMESGDLDVARAEAIRLSTTKFKHWTYEDEIRLFLPLKEQDADGRFWCQFNEVLRLREIIVGPVSDITRGDIQRVLDPADSDVELCKTRLAFQTYKVVRQRRDDLWG